MNLDGDRRIIDSFLGFGVDTTVVLFFLALEFGRTAQSFAFDSLLLLATTLMVVVLPYYLASNPKRPGFAMWIAGRGLIAAFAVSLGIAFESAVGNVLPKTVRFLPMTLLILASMTSCFIQFYALMRLRLAK